MWLRDASATRKRGCAAVALRQHLGGAVRYLETDLVPTGAVFEARRLLIIGRAAYETSERPYRLLRWGTDHCDQRSIAAG
jgi:hypothetical protein